MKTLTPAVGLFANRHGYSDVDPYEIVRIVSDKCIEIRAMDTSENKTKMNFVAGGFSHICTNQNAQDYDYTSNLERTVFKIRLNRVSKYCADKIWKAASRHGGGRFNISDEPYKFYDYNF